MYSMYNMLYNNGCVKPMGGWVTYDLNTYALDFEGTVWVISEQLWKKILRAATYTVLKSYLLLEKDKRFFTKKKFHGNHC